VRLVDSSHFLHYPRAPQFTKPQPIVDADARALVATTGAEFSLSIRAVAASRVPEHEPAEYEIESKRHWNGSHLDQESWLSGSGRDKLDQERKKESRQCVPGEEKDVGSRTGVLLERKSSHSDVNHRYGEGRANEVSNPGGNGDRSQ
jgi:hypothetical protein